MSTKSFPDSLQTGLETGVKVVGDAASAAANQAKAAADVVAAVPGRVVDMGTSLVSDGINGVQEIFNVEVENMCGFAHVGVLSMSNWDIKHLSPKTLRPGKPVISAAS
ncbi:hypothetical protein COOONC_09631 [Cooperia oncophora]